ncbi:hypothetical protein BKD09_02730 [Bradyrhizobium japonicum]|uniref:Uncharacterized protein n=1 Tax=Bradyrhizobium japonicum TaxID=375 RepID=A0A1L3F1S5_BRAJP|nr:hypothetical protein [Bradyrhizobium japonicum]APG07234.1 hypothetical protein BKD09_02730 [Bradyrhizobium japonicum]
MKQSRQSSFRERIVAEIDPEERAIWATVLVTRSRNQFRNDVSSNVARNWKFDLRQPMKITTRQIEQGTDPEVANQTRKAFSHPLGIVQRGSAAGSGFLVTPDVATIDLAEHFARRSTEIAHHLRAQPNQRGLW